MLAYCDKIADRIKALFVQDISSVTENYISECGPIEFDLHPTEGYFLSTKKVLTLKDFQGKMYKVTVEEVQ